MTCSVLMNCKIIFTYLRDRKGFLFFRILDSLFLWSLFNFQKSCGDQVLMNDHLCKSPPSKSQGGKKTFSIFYSKLTEIKILQNETTNNKKKLSSV